MAETEAKATTGDASSSSTSIALSSVHLPRIVIKFCTQCKWNLRAAYVGRSFHPRRFRLYCQLSDPLHINLSSNTFPHISTPKNSSRPSRQRSAKSLSCLLPVVHSLSHCSTLLLRLVRLISLSSLVRRHQKQEWRREQTKVLWCRRHYCGIGREMVGFRKRRS